MTAIRRALLDAGLPLDPREGEHYRTFWHVAPATHKWCQRCHERKPLDAFHDNPRGHLGRHSYCKPCRATIDRQQRKAA